ncbi:MAG TPA: NAD(P)H-binding protein [Verrucomicrobiae bacterium]|nr:NAD(P)H-binding protein [Verrucomicrobiae bacterium]
MNYLITGATGEVGSRVVKGLLHRNVRPVVFVRDQAKARALYGDNVDIRVGDLRDNHSLRAALHRIDVLFLLNSGPELIQRDAAAAQIAKAAGVQRLVKLSSLDAHHQVGTGVWHAQGESAIRATGIPFAFVRPTGFMSNALFWTSQIKAEGVLRSSTGDGRIPFIDPDDIAAVAIEALTTVKYVGESLPITGPEALSYADMAAKIAAAIQKPIRFEAISEEQERSRMAKWEESSAMIDAHISIYRAIREGRLAAVTHEVERVLRRKPNSFDHWLHRNATTISLTSGTGNRCRKSSLTADGSTSRAW